jgi:hypothetical protein
MRFKWLLLGWIFSFILFSCGSDTPSDDNVEDSAIDTLSKNNASGKVSVENIFNSIPGPAELSTLVTESGLDYDASLLNNPDALQKYTSDNFKALNLGIYGADLVYTNVHQQSQESMLYLKCVNVLCRNLGINGAFDEKTADRLETNKENRDSLLTIVSASFRQADAFLRENQRPHTSSLMVAGGWIEGLFLSAKVGIKSKNQKFIKKMSEQGQSLADLVALMEASGVTSDVMFVLQGLKDLRLSYQKIPSNAVMSNVVLSVVYKKISDLRKKIILE